MNRYEIALGKIPPPSPKKIPDGPSFIDNFAIEIEFGDRSYKGQLISLSRHENNYPSYKGEYWGFKARLTLFLNLTEDCSFLKQEARFNYNNKRYSLMIQDSSLSAGPNGLRIDISGQAVEIYEV